MNWINFDKPQRNSNEVENEPEFSKNLTKIVLRIRENISGYFAAFLRYWYATHIYVQHCGKKYVKFEYKVFVL